MHHLEKSEPRHKVKLGVRHPTKRRMGYEVRPPVNVLAERDRRLGVVVTRPSELLLGDPVRGTGQSALERRELPGLNRS
jgi:hypothetical protein